MASRPDISVILLHLCAFSHEKSAGPAITVFDPLDRTSTKREAPGLTGQKQTYRHNLRYLRGKYHARGFKDGIILFEDYQ
jgi:hypothetical protein